MIDRHPLFELAAHNAQERQPVPVRRVHVGLNLKNEAAEVGRGGLHQTDIRLPGQGRGRDRQKRLQKRLHAEIAHSRTKEQRGQLAGQHRSLVKGIARFVQKLDLIPQTVAVVLLQRLFGFGAVQRDG